MMMRRRYREFLNLELWADWFSALIEKWRWTAVSLPAPPPLFFSRKKKMSLSLSLRDRAPLASVLQLLLPPHPTHHSRNELEAPLVFFSFLSDMNLDWF